MKTLFLLGVTVIAIVALLAGGFFRSFKAKSESVLDKSVGMNGSFEITKSGLPVNWLIYTQKTISTGDYDFIIDSEQYKSGTQSLKFVVRTCSPDGGWHSPGFSQEYDAIPGTVYKVNFWVKNEGAEFRVKVGGITGDKGVTKQLYSQVMISPPGRSMSTSIRCLPSSIGYGLNLTF